MHALSLRSIRQALWRFSVKSLPWGLLIGGAVLFLGAAAGTYYGYSRAWRFVGESPTVRPSEVTDLLSQAHWIAGVCTIFGALGIAAMIAGYVLWAHEK
jgi:hypothetical protein